MAKNAPKVPFMVSTRESWQKIHASSSQPNAGPGDYDVVRGMKALSTSHKTISDGSFFTARKDSGVPGLQTAAGPGEYNLEVAQDYVKPRAGKIPFPQAKRWPVAHNENYPAPRAYQFVERHTPHMPFPTGRGHTMESADPVTAAVPIRAADRPAKHKQAFKFTTAPRFGKA